MAYIEVLTSHDLTAERVVERSQGAAQLPRFRYAGDQPITVDLGKRGRFKAEMHEEPFDSKMSRGDLGFGI